MDPTERVLFAEINEHLRATDTKHVQVSIGYLGAMSIVASIIAQRPSELTTNSLANVIAYSLVIAIGIAAYSAQEWYRAWKLHYIDCACGLMCKCKISDDHRPSWLRREKGQSKAAVSLPFVRGNFDNALHYLTAAFTLVFAGLLGAVLLDPWSLGFLVVAFVADLMVLVLVLIRFHDLDA
ncbi:MAG: hypothetical protein CVT67_09055 [Actinobacteria bacterium HGW-Actinobacteria-7]|nr:MAG: hypothetical protein CVT67_09055 [Actinobacteria bacterium HGW-Actinobacteria-7]